MVNLMHIVSAFLLTSEQNLYNGEVKLISPWESSR